MPIDGLADFIKLTGNLIFGENSPAIKQGRVATMQVRMVFFYFCRASSDRVVQSLSGTGALRIGFAFIKRWFPANTTILISNPTWGMASSPPLHLADHSLQPITTASASRSACP